MYACTCTLPIDLCKVRITLQMNQEATKGFNSLKVTYGMAIATSLGRNIIIRLGLGLGFA